MIWELILRRIVDNPAALPRFNSRIFFYLFLPSTILDSASLLANKWLFLNMFNILMLSIFGTLIYAASIGFTIFFLSQDSNFNVYVKPTSLIGPLTNPIHANENQRLPNLIGDSIAKQFSNSVEGADKGLARSSELDSDLTLIECLVFGTILSSVDSTTMLDAFRQNQVNEKLYYLVLGENLMNNAVVLVIFNILIDFLNATRLTVVKIYFAILQFFITLIGAILIGFALAALALVTIRLVRRYQVVSLLSSYQSQCQSMLEVLLILKLAYFSYTLASMAGTSSILGLATFGLLQDQYIKVNLSVRSQFTLRQVILATKTLGHSLVYPLIGMLFVEVAHTSQFFYQAWLSLEPNIWPTNVLPSPGINSNQTSNQKLAAINRWTSANNKGSLESSFIESVSLDTTTRSMLNATTSRTETLYWNFKLLSLVTLISLAYRFIVVILLTQVTNILSGRQMKIRLKEHVLLAFGSLKGPLALALVHRLIEHEEYKEKTVRNKYLFIYTILFITFASNIIKGSFVGPLVHRMRLSLCHSSASLSNSSSYIVFTEISCMITDCITHGLNSILGRHKSSYDKFVEFNETHIKPWLAGSGSNTNWLSVFYNHLILEETMSANGYSHSIRETARVLAGNEQTRGPNNIHQQMRKSSSLSDVIEQDLMKSSDSDRIDANTSSRNPQTSSNLIPKRLVRVDSKLKQRSESAILRELIMYNLKLEDSRRRKAKLSHHGIEQSPSTTKSKQIANITMNLAKERQMLSTSSSTNDEPKVQSSVNARLRRKSNSRYPKARNSNSEFMIEAPKTNAPTKLAPGKRQSTSTIRKNSKGPNAGEFGSQQQPHESKSTQNWPHRLA